MATLVTLADLLTRCRDRSEIRGAFNTPANLTAMLNAGIAELWRFINSINSDWLMSDDPYEITIVSGQQTYPLAPDHYLARGADILDNDGEYRNLRKYNHGERNKFQTASADKAWVAYRISGTRFQLIPEPSYTGTARIWYISTPPVLASTATTGTATAGSLELASVASTAGIGLGNTIYLAGEQNTHRVRGKTASTLTLDRSATVTGAGLAISRDTLDTIAGFEEYPILSTLIKHAALEESDPSVFMAQLGDIKEQIRDAVGDRDVGEPDRIRDVRREWFDTYEPTWDNP